MKGKNKMKTIKIWHAAENYDKTQGLINIADLLPFFGKEGYEFVFHTESGEVEGDYISNIIIRYMSYDDRGIRIEIDMEGEYCEQYGNVRCVEIYEDK